MLHFANFYNNIRVAYIIATFYYNFRGAHINFMSPHFKVHTHSLMRAFSAGINKVWTLLMAYTKK